MATIPVSKHLVDPMNESLAELARLFLCLKACNKNTVSAPVPYLALPYSF
jgi:hypothetical protein